MTLTADRQYTTVDKSSWGDGPWRDEPDKVQWVDEATGLDCLINRGPLGALCGYVGLPPDHPCHGADYDEVKAQGGYVDVHGGLTYADRCQESDNETVGVCHVPLPGRPADVWWLGFDCAHSGDVAPAMEARYRARGEAPIRMGYESYRTVRYVQRKVTDLAALLITATVEKRDA